MNRKGRSLILYGLSHMHLQTRDVQFEYGLSPLAVIVFGVRRIENFGNERNLLSRVGGNGY